MTNIRAINFMTFVILFLFNLSFAVEYEQHWVDFSRSDGKYLREHLELDFGNGYLDTSKKVYIVDSVAQVRFLTGKKISMTAMQSRVAIPIRQQYSLKYKIRFDPTFEQGMHGKQFGFYGGRGTYDGGKAEQCRTNGDGWNVKLQFDAHENTVSNQLYVYYSQMTGTFGNTLGTGSIKYHIPKGQWVEIGMTISMQTHADSANGRVEVWSDGVKQFDIKGIRFVTKEEGRTIRSVSLDHFNGGGGIFPTKDSFSEFDDMRWWAGPMDADPWANQTPIVSFVKPGLGLSLLAPANLMVEALASDPDGSIDNVRLYLNGDLVRQENLSPYTWNDPTQNDLVLTHLPAGAHQLRLVATDDSGDSSEVTQIITINSPPSSSSSEISSSSLSSSSGLLYSSSSESETPVTNLQIRHNSFSQENEISFDWKDTQQPAKIAYRVVAINGLAVTEWIIHSTSRGHNSVVFMENTQLSSGLYIVEVRESGILRATRVFSKF
jgi:hypothetical protein